MKIIERSVLFTIVLLGSFFNQITLADAPGFCKEWRDSYPSLLGGDQYIRWDKVNKHVLANIDYGFRAHGSRSVSWDQDNIYFYNDEDYFVGDDEISRSSGDAKMAYNFSMLGTQSIWIMNVIDLGAPAKLDLCAKTEVHVQNRPTLDTLTTYAHTIDVGWSSFYTSGGSMSDVSKHSLQNKQIEYLWRIYHSDTNETTDNFTTAVPYTKYEFVYGGEYVVSVVTFDGTFRSNSKMLYISVKGPKKGGGGIPSF